MMNLDQKIIYAGLRLGESRTIYCVDSLNKPASHMGHPVVRLDDGTEWSLEEVAYRNATMLIEGTVIKGTGSGLPAVSTIENLLKSAPRMVGITCGENENVSAQDRRRGYISVEPWWSKTGHALKQIYG